MVVEHDGGGGWSSDYQSELGENQDYLSDVAGLGLDVDDLVGYGLSTARLANDAGMSPHVMKLGESIHAGLAGSPQPDPHVGAILPFPEGARAAQVLAQRMADFQSFFRDLGIGLTCIGSAAVAVAEMYQDADSENAADIGDISFAFADRGSQPPPGFRDYQPVSDTRSKEGGEDQDAPMAMMGDDSRAQVSTVENGPHSTIFYSYPDGSRKAVESNTSVGSDGVERSVEVTRIYAPGGTLLFSTAEESYTYAGDEVHNTTVTRGDAENNVTSATSTVTHSDGSQTVITTESTTQDGGTTVDRTDRTTIAPHERRLSTDEPGPIEEAVDSYGTYGNEETVDEFGRGY